MSMWKKVVAIVKKPSSSKKKNKEKIKRKIVTLCIGVGYSSHIHKEWETNGFCTKSLRIDYPVRPYDEDFFL